MRARKDDARLSGVAVTKFRDQAKTLGPILATVAADPFVPLEDIMPGKPWVLDNVAFNLALGMPVFEIPTNGGCFCNRKAAPAAPAALALLVLLVNRPNWWLSDLNIRILAHRL